MAQSSRGSARVSVFEEFGVRTVINVAGAPTRLGGPQMNLEAAKAMLEASQYCVRMDELQARASQIISVITGSEAGYVTSGAAASLTLAAAACLCHLDFRLMNRLPETSGTANEIVICREQRSGYDHALRAAGAVLVEVGMNEVVAGAGVRRSEAWEIATAITPRTAAVAYVCSGTSQPPLEDVVSVCRERSVPLIVDAAGQLPPIANLRRFAGLGVDLVTFSGGKAIRGPQGTGFLAGRRDLIMSVALQNLDLDEHWELWDPPKELIDKSLLRGLPRHGLGRGFKVSKEQVIGLLSALKSFSGGGDRKRMSECRGLLSKVAEALADLSNVKVEFCAELADEGYTVLEITVPGGSAEEGFQAARLLRARIPRSTSANAYFRMVALSFTA